MSTLQEIERAIDALAPPELAELYTWLDQKHLQPMDTRLACDLADGRLDSAILRALDDEANGSTRLL